MEENKTLQAITLSSAEAEEYQAYKREKHILEVMGYIQKAVLDGQFDDAKKITATAVKHGAAAVKVLPTQLSVVRALLESSKVKIDCLIGGTGETFSKVKVYETKLARRAGAQELTLCLNETDVKNNRFHEIKKEIQRVCKAAKGAPIKVRLNENWGNETLGKLCKIAWESGAKFVSVPYFEGCQRLKNDLYTQLNIEVTNVVSTAVFKKMAGAGMQRIQTSRLQSIYDELMREAENVTVEQAEKPKADETQKEQELGASTPAPVRKKKSQDYKQLIENK